MRKSYLGEIVETVDEMIAEGQNNISIDEILREHYKGKLVDAATRNSIRKRLPRIRKILHDALHYDICLLSRNYFTAYKRGGVKDIAQGHRCLPMRGREYQAYGLHLRTGNDDFIWKADIQRNLGFTNGGRKKVIDRINDAVDKGDINGKEAGLLVQDQDKRFELNNNIQWKWLPTNDERKPVRKVEIDDDVLYETGH